MELIGDTEKASEKPVYKDFRRHLVNLYQAESPPTIALTNGHSVSDCFPSRDGELITEQGSQLLPLLERLAFSEMLHVSTASSSALWD